MHVFVRYHQSLRRTSRIAVLVAAAAVVLAACAGAVDDTGSSAASAVPPSPTAPIPDGDPAPAGQFALFEGSVATFADFAGRPLVVNFWASWCPSCVAEMSAAFRPVEEQVGDQVTFLGMNIQDQRDRALQLLEETGVQWLSAEDPAGAIYVELGGLGMPFTVLMDADGSIVDRHNGPLSESQLRSKLSEHFGI